MKLNQSTEQGVYVVIILALQKEHKPIKSSILAEILQVSDSYLKKILRKLVVADVINSEASKEGGFILNRKIEAISFGDVYQAIQGNQDEIKFNHVGDQLFDDTMHVREGENKIMAALKNADVAFIETLNQIQMSSLLETYAISNGAIDWLHQLGE